MTNLKSSKLSEIEVFVKVIQMNGFTEAAKYLRLTPSAVSKSITRLENRLGAVLLNRSTRKLSLTPEGLECFEQSIDILQKLANLEASFNSTKIVPSGLLKITCSVPFAFHQILERLKEFRTLYPLISIELHMSDAVCDIIAEGFDMSIFIGLPQNSSLRARKLGESKMTVVAAPEYIALNGQVTEPSQLYHHNCLRFQGHKNLNIWPFRINDKTIKIDVKGAMSADNGEAIRHMTLIGEGISRLSDFMVRKDIDEGKLIPLLESFDAEEYQQIYLLFPHSSNVTARLKVLIEFLVESFNNQRTWN